MATIYDKLTAIGDAIRMKTGGTDLLSLDDMADHINSISISGSGATLTVVAEAGARVTVSNGIKSYTKTADADGNVIFQGLEDGTWTINGISNNITATDTIDIDTFYSKQVKFATYLYNNGVMYAPLTSNFVGYGGTITNNNNMLTYTTNYNSTTGNYNTYLMTSERIDLTGYNWLYVDFNSVGQANICVGFDGPNAGGQLIMDTCMKVAHIGTNTVYKISLSGVNSGSYKFGIACEGLASGDKGVINNIWLSASDAYEAKTATPQQFQLLYG